MVLLSDSSFSKIEYDWPYGYKYDNPSPPPLELLQLDLFTLIFHESIHTILRDTENNYPGRALRLPETI
ncbi:unnamed protein product, partial [Rotaria magnacalcarata]